MEIRGRGQNDKPQHRVNEQIRAASVRVVGENVEAGVYPLKEALAMAEAAGADQLKKKQKEIKAKSVKVVVKEIRFGPQTDDHDFNFKLKHAIGFLQEGAKVRAYVFFKGRSILFKDQGADLLERFVNALEDYGKLESAPMLEGKKMIVVIAPKK